MGRILFPLNSWSESLLPITRLYTRTSCRPKEDICKKSNGVSSNGTTRRSRSEFETSTRPVYPSSWLSLPTSRRAVSFSAPAHRWTSVPVSKCSSPCRRRLPGQIPGSGDARGESFELSRPKLPRQGPETGLRFTTTKPSIRQVYEVPGSGEGRPRSANESLIS